MIQQLISSIGVNCLVKIGGIIAFAIGVCKSFSPLFVCHL